MGSQSEHLWSISRLNTVAFRLPSVTCDDAKVRTSDCEDGATVLRVGVELSLLGMMVRGRVNVMGHNCTQSTVKVREKV